MSEAGAEEDRRRERRRVYEAYDEAAANAEFMREMEDVDREFAPAIGDGLGE
jgi:hypothetical protein